MNHTADQLTRLQFLERIARKEIDLLLYAESKAFNPPLTLNLVENLEHEQDLALRLEAFSSRFCRLQDTLGDKLLPNLLEALQEPRSPFLVNLQKAEKYQWLSSSEQWITLRQIRDQMVHEYIEHAQKFYDAIQTAKENIPFLIEFANNLSNETKKYQNNKTKI
jgi:hypothetical protein